MIYIDSSSLLKLVISDEHSVAVEEAAAKEAVILVSSLTDLEIYVQFRGLSRSGKRRLRQVKQGQEDLQGILENRPFTKRPLMGQVFSDALQQHKLSAIHCRSLDRLHLAAMEELGVGRLMTHDGRQAEAARELGYEVVMPGVA
jgi:predicted nucleic acid-binding protein